MRIDNDIVVKVYTPLIAVFFVTVHWPTYALVGLYNASVLYILTIISDQLSEHLPDQSSPNLEGR